MSSVNPSISKGDSDSQRADSSEAIIILDRLRSAHNVGNMLRLADAINARCVYTCGYTCTPPHEKLKKTAMGTDEFVPCRHFPDSKSAVEAALSEGYEIVAVDTIEGSENCLQSNFQSKKIRKIATFNPGLNLESAFLDRSKKTWKIHKKPNLKGSQSMPQYDQTPRHDGDYL